MTRQRTCLHLPGPTVVETAATFILRSLVACILSVHALVATGVEVLKSDEGRLAYGEWHGYQRVYRAHFDADHRLHWDDSPLPQAVAGDCPPSTSSQVDDRMGPRRRVLLGRPRVDELRCPDGSFLIQGLDTTGRLRWQRPRGERNIIGRSEQSLVTADLEVWIPETGETLVPAPIRRGAMPRYRFHYAALYRPAAGDFILYDPQPYQFGTKVAGLYRLLPASGSHELLLADGRCGFMGLGRKRVVDLRADPAGRYLYLLRRCDHRGFPPQDGLAVLDAATRTILFEDQYDRDQQVVAMAQAGNGDLGIALQDTRQRQVHLLRYRLSEK